MRGGLLLSRTCTQQIMLRAAQSQTLTFGGWAVTPLETCAIALALQSALWSSMSAGVAFVIGPGVVLAVDMWHTKVRLANCTNLLREVLQMAEQQTVRLRF